MTIKHEDGKTDTYTYDTAEIQPSLTACMPGDSVIFLITKATMVDNLLVNKGNTVEAIYDVSGRKLPEKQRGVNIMLYSDGTHRKVIVK